MIDWCVMVYSNSHNYRASYILLFLCFVLLSACSDSGVFPFKKTAFHNNVPVQNLAPKEKPNQDQPVSAPVLGQGAEEVPVTPPGTSSAAAPASSSPAMPSSTPPSTATGPTCTPSRLPSYTSLAEEDAWTPTFIPAEDELVYFSFNNSNPAQADVLRGGGSPRVERNLQGNATEGRPNPDGYPSGAIRTGNMESAFYVPSRGNILGEQGNISFWAKPLDWNSLTIYGSGIADAKSRSFFSVLERNNTPQNNRYLSLYKFFNSPLYWFYSFKLPNGIWQPFIASPCGDFSWRQGEWTFVSANWSGAFMKVYLNGNSCGEVRLPTTEPLRTEYLEAEMRVGGNQVASSANDTLLDDFRIFRRPLKSKEIVLLRDRGNAAIVSRGEDPDQLHRISPEIVLNVAYDQSTHAVKGDISLLNIPKPSAERSYLTRLEIRPQGARLDSEPLLCMEERVSNTSPQLTLPASSLGVGNYQANITVLNAADRVPLTQKTAHFSRSAELNAPWVNFAQNYENQNMAPYTSPRLEGGEVQIWGRRYQMSGQKILPTQIYSQTQRLFLASPKINFQLEGQAPQDLMNVMNVTAAPVISARSMIWNANQHLSMSRPVDVSTQTEIQEDGLISLTVHVRGSGAVLNQFELELSLDPQTVRLMHADIDARNTNGKITRRIFAPITQPLFWLGNEQVGIQWLTNQLTDWNLSNSNEAFEILPSTSPSSPVTFKVHMVNQRMEVPAGGLKYEFALQATPVKAMLSGWRRWDLMVNGGFLSPPIASWNPFDPIWNSTAEIPEGVFCGFKATDPARTRQHFEDTRRYFSSFLYWDMAGMWKGDPILRDYALDFGVHYDSQSHECVQNADLWSRPLARSYAIYQLLDNLRQIPLLNEVSPGFYLDVAQPAWQVKGGNKPFVEWDWKSKRELQRSFYGALKEQYPHKIVMNHQSSANLMAQLAYSDVLVTGEKVDQNILRRDRAYYNIYDLDSFRAEFAPQKYGIPIFYLPQIYRSLEDSPANLRWLNNDPESLKASEHILGLVFLHDLMNYSAYVQVDPARWITQIKNSFGWDDAVEFIGYWDVASRNLISMPAAPQDVVVSVFRRNADHKLLLMFFNNTNVQVTVNPTLNLNELLPGTARFRVSDPYLALKSPHEGWRSQVSPQLLANQSPPLDAAGRLSNLLIPGRNFRILNIQGE